MSLSDIRERQLFSLALIFLILFAFSGCALVGPPSISMGRADYNEAIDRTENEQMLMAIVKGCYGETFSLLSVSGVAANVRFSTRAGIQAGFGPGDNYIGNLIPLSGGVAYEENPTITYAPVQGERYLRQLMSPIPLDILVLFVRSGLYPGPFLTILADRVNDLQNPDFLNVCAAAGPDLRFQRFAELNEELILAGIVQWVEDPRDDIPFAILISEWRRYYREEIQEYLGLLGFTMPEDPTKDLVLPVYFGIKSRDTNCVAISTRSTIDLIQILRGAVEIPSEHLARGLATTFPEPGLAGKGIRIRSSVNRPETAALAVKYRGYWFFIDESDVATKRFYMMVRTLWSVTISAGADQRAAPVLTIPVSR